MAHVPPFSSFVERLAIGLVSVWPRWFYRVHALGLEHLPKSGGSLLLANHLSTVDVLLLKLASPRVLVFPRSQKGSDQVVAKALGEGQLVCLFPEGEISRLGTITQLQPEVIALARRANAVVIPVALDGIWGSVFSYSWGNYFFKRLRLSRIQVTVVFGAALSSEQITLLGVRAALLDAASVAFAARPLLKQHLGRVMIKALAHRPGRVAVVDRTAARRELSAARILAAACALSRWLRVQVPEKRIGIVLPPGAGAVIANLAVVAAGKVPVNLNFTAGRKTVEASLRVAEVNTIVSAAALQAKFPDFPWTDHVVDLALTLGSLGKPALLKWLLAAWLVPGDVLADWLQLPKTADGEEAGLLFTSGSAGDPKGVVLTHRNLLANCAQISSTNVLPEKATLLGCLPIFHSFGFTVTIWYALIRQMRLVTIPSPLETKKMVDAIREEKVTVVVAAPTFLRPLLKKATPADLQSLDLLVSGAEKMPLELFRAFQENLQIGLTQGFGLTETAPVSNLNQPDRPSARSGATQIGGRLGSVGKMLPGMTARICDPDTGEALPSTVTGLLLLRGENVFSGYLNDPAKTATALRDGWFWTGDLARFDDDGFLYIEGRLSRFSKIGGEMVPHGTIEQKLNEAFDWDPQEGPKCVVVGVPDAAKGEMLVVVTTEAVNLDQVREALSAAGLPNLWIPRRVCTLVAIPLLGTGKIDLQACREAALRAG